MAIVEATILEQYLRRTPRSRQLAERARHVFPSGITHDSRQLDPYPIFVERASGSRKWDVDGNEYVDYAGGHGALLLGHNPPQVVQAVAAQLARGTHFGACHELELRWGELVQQLVPCAQRVRFTSSGTEATMLAVRLARAATGRRRLVRFLGHFHGWHDHMAFGVGSHFDGTPTPGVLPGVAEEVSLAPPNDAAATERLLERGDVAAVIIEPTGASWGQVPVLPSFLAALREMATRTGTLLIFDEVISGFRCSPGGAQAALGITPDLTTLAKIVAGGLPGGAVVGQADVLDQLAFSTGAASREKVPHQGTFNANPLSAAAGIATLETIASTDVCQRANDYAARLRTALNNVLRAEHTPWVVYGTYSGFHIFTNPERRPITADDIAAGRYDYRTFKSAHRATVNTLRLGMLVHGVDLFSWPGGPTSAVHTDDDLAQTVDAFRATVRLMRDI
ncbi:MAG TPA: aspartate aminotransferase family protein [Pirellulales bacterium]|nr:aspartate aminotransferase family protein [Pirellulales bacterium]